MKTILIIGAASAIAQETARIFARDNFHFYLVDLSLERLKIIVDDLKVFGAGEVYYNEMDANHFDKHDQILKDALNKLGQIDYVLIAYGTLANHEEIINDPEQIAREFSTNATSVILLTSLISNYFEKINKGTLAVISSVAGDRGRKSNYIYGSAKGAVSIFLQGLRNRFGKSNVKIITIKPGLVDTPMTAHLKKNFLFTSAETIAKGIYNAMMKGKDVVYLPFYWKCIMTIIKLIPERVFKRMNL